MSAEKSAAPSPFQPDLLEKIILTTIDIPSLPAVARKVLELVNDDRSSVTELEQLIYRDHSFSTRLLRIANSSFYGRRQSIDTISEAILLIGFKTLRALVVGASMRDLHKKFGPVEQRFWQHSLAVSIASSLLARETRAVRPEEALVAGLVHDVGKTVMNNSLANYYSSVIEKAEESGTPAAEAETRAFGFNHCEVGGYLARKWLFPGELLSAIAYHHTPQLPPLGQEAEGRLCRVVGTADTLCLRLGIGFRRDAAFPAEAMDELGLSEERVISLGDAVREAYAEYAAQALD